MNSPYRLPLIKYLNHYTHETVNYFFQRRDLPQRQLFWLILRTKEAEPVRWVVAFFMISSLLLFFPPVIFLLQMYLISREELIRNSDLLINSTFKINIPAYQHKVEMQIYGISLVRILLKYRPNYLETHRDVLYCLTGKLLLLPLWFG